MPITDLLLLLSKRDLEKNQMVLLGLAVRQLQLIEMAYRQNRIAMAQGGLSTLHYNAIGRYVETSDGHFGNEVIRRLTAEGKSEEISETMSRPGALAETCARAFVYELAVLRNCVKSALATSDPMASKAILASFDQAVPGVVAVRDTLAHLDERMVGEVRKAPFVPNPTVVAGDEILLGLAIQGETFSAHVADGSFVGIKLHSSTIERAKALVFEALMVFPEKT